MADSPDLGSSADLSATVGFVGAGISAPAGLPQFGELRKELYDGVLKWRWMGPRTRRRMAEGLELLAPEYAVSLLDTGPETPREYICERLSAGDPTAEHRLLVAAIGGGARVYTPNFDLLIERASLVPLEVAVRSSPDAPIGSARLLKLHGSCPTILVSAEDVMLSVSGSWADRFLEDCARPNSHLLIWGYRGADPDLVSLVRRGASLAARCTWIAFSEVDRDRAQSILRGIEDAAIRFVDEDVVSARREAQAILDPDHKVSVQLDAGVSRGCSGDRVYAIKSRATTASAIAHLGSARLGRLAWLDVVLHGNRVGVGKLGRSYLYDSRLVQSAVLTVASRSVARRPSLRRWSALLVAAEGHGVRPSSDRVISLYETTEAFSSAKDDAGLQARARVATLMRNRGRLFGALRVLDGIERDLTDEKVAETKNATWTGRLTFERAITQRLRGELDASRRILSSIDTGSVSIVGANWTMWLEDEHCALAIEGDRRDKAEECYARSRQLAMAYGQHRMATADLAIRGLEIRMLESTDVDAIFAAAREQERAIWRAGILTPLRRAWLIGVRADSARRAGDTVLANKCHTKLLRSPHLVHHLAACVGFALSGEPVPRIDIQHRVDIIGPTRIGSTVQLLMPGRRSNGTSGYLEELRSRRGFLFLI